MRERFDVIIIGAGQAGVPLASAFGAEGRKTALIEKAQVGGTCVNVGCTPTKTMVASARVAALARRAEEYGVSVGNVAVDMGAVRQRKRDIVDSFRGGSERRLAKGDNVEVIYGTAAFTGEKQLQVQLNGGGTRELTAPTIVIDVGGRATIPPIQGLKEVPFLDSTSIMELDELPEHLVILGGGYISLEFGQMFRRFGSAVTTLEHNARLLPREDEDIAACVREILEADGIAILTGAEAKAVAQTEKGCRVTVEVEGEEKRVEGSHLLVAAGRTPNSDLLNLEAGGIKSDKRGFIEVNERLETNVEGVYATGDVTGGPAFTHISYDDYRILRANLLEGGNRTTEGRMVPYVVYIDPQLGRVGMSEQEARKAGREIQVFTMPMSSVARALETAETAGMLKVIVEAETKKILGAAALGIEGGEVMSMLQIAIMGELPYTALRDGIFAHPTIAEGLNNLFAQ